MKAGAGCGKSRFPSVGLIPAVLVLVFRADDV